MKITFLIFLFSLSVLADPPTIGPVEEHVTFRTTSMHERPTYATGHYGGFRFTLDNGLTLGIGCRRGNGAADNRRRTRPSHSISVYRIVNGRAEEHHPVYTFPDVASCSPIQEFLREAEDNNRTPSCQIEVDSRPSGRSRVDFLIRESDRTWVSHINRNLDARLNGRRVETRIQGGEVTRFICDGQVLFGADETITATEAPNIDSSDRNVREESSPESRTSGSQGTSQAQER